MSAPPKKRKAPLARQLKIKSQAASAAGPPFDVVECAMDIRANAVAHRREVSNATQACTAAIRDMEEVQEGPELKDKLRQLSGLFRVLSDKYSELLQHTVRIEAAVELAVSSRHQYAMEIARGDVESASASALMSSDHR